MFNFLQSSTPWPWYIARAAAGLAYLFLWLSIFLGLSIRNPLLKKIIAPIYRCNLHCFLAALAVFWAFIHASSLLFDQSINFSLADIAIPFFSPTTIVNVFYLGLGIMAFYSMIAVVLISYNKCRLNFWFWRIMHFLNPVAFVFVVLHGYIIGTDTKNALIGNSLLLASIVLCILYLSNLLYFFWQKYSRLPIK